MELRRAEASRVAVPADRFAPPPETREAVEDLRLSLQRIGFRETYKYLVGVNRYGILTSLFNRDTAEATEAFFSRVLGDAPELLLLQVLLSGRRAERGRLDAGSRRTADALAEAGLLEGRGRSLGPGPWQLLSFNELDLLIDRRLHFRGGVHEVYVGPDSLLMLYYVDAARLRREYRALDLCTGTGLAALYLARFCHRVVATDIGAEPLKLAGLNRELNAATERVEIRDQPLAATLAEGERFDVLTCNPPFVAYPPGVEGSLYSHGTDTDGLGYMRDILNALEDVLVPGGTAYLVADLVGDGEGPYFLDEVAELVSSRGFAADVFIDNILPAAVQVEPMVSHLESLHPERDREDLRVELEHFQRRTLRAECYYMSTLKVRTAVEEPRLRVFRRHLPPPPSDSDPWPDILRRR